jgi:hypothetical protein
VQVTNTLFRGDGCVSVLLTQKNLFENPSVPLVDTGTLMPEPGLMFDEFVVAVSGECVYVPSVHVPLIADFGRMTWPIGTVQPVNELAVFPVQVMLNDAMSGGVTTSVGIRNSTGIAADTGRLPELIAPVVVRALARGPTDRAIGGCVASRA